MRFRCSGHLQERSERENDGDNQDDHQDCSQENANSSLCASIFNHYAAGGDYVPGGSDQPEEVAIRSGYGDSSYGEGTLR
jgi:hypothetical protein